MDPTLVGNSQTILVSDMSGQSNILAKAAELGFEFQKGAPEVSTILKKDRLRGRRLQTDDGIRVSCDWENTSSYGLDERFKNSHSLFESSDSICCLRL
jgi:hypothetical protein